MAEKYDMQIDLGTDCAQTRTIRLVGEAKSVLELGCATGYVSRLLTQQRGCHVVGIERNHEAAAEARRACDEVIVADLDDLDYERQLGARRFDVVLCGDVLEHLRDPGRVLARLRPFLRPDGYVVASIPNVVHASVVAELLGGHFPYRPWGLLDDTHLRFFTRDSIYECFEGAGFVISHLERVLVEPSATEFRTDLSRVPEAVARVLLAGEESRTYQFVLTAHPAEGEVTIQARPGTVQAEEHPSAPVRGAHAGATVGSRALSKGKLEAVRGRIEHLRHDRERLERELERLHCEDAARLREVEALHREVAKRAAEVEWLHQEVAVRDTEVARLHREVALRDHRVEDLAATADSALLRVAAAEKKLRELASHPLVRLWQRLRALWNRDLARRAAP